MLAWKGEGCQRVGPRQCEAQSMGGGHASLISSYHWTVPPACTGTGRRWIDGYMGRPRLAQHTSTDQVQVQVHRPVQSSDARSPLSTSSASCCPGVSPEYGSPGPALPSLPSRPSSRIPTSTAPRRAARGSVRGTAPPVVPRRTGRCPRCRSRAAGENWRNGLPSRT